MKRYNPQELEPKWQQIWSDTNLYKADMSNSAEKYFVIPMFPYPSGDLHIGHWYNFGPTDTVARYHRMQGQNVLTTIGFDAFGLPAENAAIKRKIQPATWTRSNIASMTMQLQKLGASYDWDHTLMTCDPSFYRWNQWLFLKLYEKGLAYRKKALVNWCPKDLTVLANEQVIGEDNVCERCGTAVIQKELEQWFFKITDYADRLLDDLDKIEWPGRVRAMQTNWIGRSQGAIIKFKLEHSKNVVDVFTTRPDTIFGATYMVLAPDHPLIAEVVMPEQKSKVDGYITKASRKTELERKTGQKDKAGVFSGSFAINPATNQPIPIWIADYVLMNYGTGSIMAVPAHDERDFAFATAHSLPIVKVVECGELPYTGEGKLVNSGNYNGLSSTIAKNKIVDDLAKNGISSKQVNYRLRDWLISRQRYWGTPIPIIYCDKCGIQTVPEDQLPLILPEDVEFEHNGQSPLKQRKDFVNTTCPNCKAPAKRETDTMDGFMDSSWYFLRYLDNHNDKEAFNRELINQWMPVDHYIGGIEHAILHLLYARFITKFLSDHHGLNFDEPFKRLTNQGIILGPDGLKMSKSRGNVVSPDEQVNSYGADSLRLYMMFMGPYDLGGPYSLGGIAGTRRFLDRYWTLVGEYLDTTTENTNNNTETAILASTHKTIKKVTADIEQMSFNTAIAAMMTLINDLYKIKTNSGIVKSPAWQYAFESLTQLLAPFAPHITEEVWCALGHSTSVHISLWPTYDENLVQDQMITIAVQVNGKIRAELLVDKDISEAEVIKLAKSNDSVAKYIIDKQVKKEIYVKGRLVSLVI